MNLFWVGWTVLQDILWCSWTTCNEYLAQIPGHSGSLVYLNIFHQMAIVLNLNKSELSSMYVCIVCVCARMRARVCVWVCMCVFGMKDDAVCGYPSLIWMHTPGWTYQMLNVSQWTWRHRQISLYDTIDEHCLVVKLDLWPQFMESYWSTTKTWHVYWGRFCFSCLDTNSPGTTITKVFPSHSQYHHFDGSSDILTKLSLIFHLIE